MEVDKKGGYSHCAAHDSVALRNEKTWNVLLANETGYHRGWEHRKRGSMGLPGLCRMDATLPSGTEE